MVVEGEVPPAAAVVVSIEEGAALEVWALGAAPTAATTPATITSSLTINTNSNTNISTSTNITHTRVFFLPLVASRPPTA